MYIFITMFLWYYDLFIVDIKIELNSEALYELPVKISGYTFFTETYTRIELKKARLLNLAKSDISKSSS